MELDEYEYLERAVEFPSAPASKPSPPPPSKPSRRSEDPKPSRRSEDPKPPRRSEDRHGDRDRDHRSRHRSSRDDERGRGRQSRSRTREREYDDRHHRHRDRRSREYEEDVERERERERRRRSISRHEREAEIEREARSRERRARERESESMERRRFKEKKELEAEADPERDQRTVFAYQMPLKATERDVYEFFSQAGKVRDVKLIMDRLSRRSKGVGYIEFVDAMSVPYAIALSNKLLLGQPVMVKASEAEKNLVQSTTTASGAAGAGADRKIYVGNLHYNMTEAHLRQIFEAFGPLELVQLPLDPATGHCKGYGFIQFQQLEHAKSARHLNGTLDIAGRIIKVSAVTDHVGGQTAGTNVADFDDDDDGGGLTLNARSRAILMQKLDRTGTATGIVESLGVPGLNGLVSNLPAASLPINGVPLVPAIANAQHLPSLEPIGDPSECLLLKNMFDPSAETDPDFYSDIKEEVEDECSKFGPVRHIFVDRNSNGFVYLRFESVAPAVGCQRAMHNRYYAGRSISATFMRPEDYDARFRSDV